MLKQSLRKLSKNISRKNLFNFIEGYIKKIENETGELNEIKVLTLITARGRNHPPPSENRVFSATDHRMNPRPVC